MKCLLLVVISCTVSTRAGSYVFGPVVDTRKGRIRGVRETVDGKDVDMYFGIPFAKPPVGDLRFKHPIPNDPWQDELHATQKPYACWQGLEQTFSNLSAAMAWSANTNRSEDCLYLNVWVPGHTNRSNNLDVMVWIFGGGFFSGSSSLEVYDARYLAVEQNVIVVSMQYRLGALGFLVLDHRDPPGNAGLFDQVMALEWVQQNIINFGGNPQSVTLFGESAGAVSVGLHLLSPLSRGKFHKAILQSGAPNAAWAVLTDDEAINRSMKLAKVLGCKQGSAAEILSCLRRVDAEQFQMNEWSTIDYGVVRFPFVPVVDGVFLTEMPQHSLDTNNFMKCPVLLGHNTNEASYWLLYMYYNTGMFTLLKEPRISQDKFDVLIDDLFKYHPYYPLELNPFGIEAIKFHYRNWMNPNDQQKNAWEIDMASGDFHFICPTIDFAHRYASNGNDVYFYVFEHRSKRHPWPEWMGVLHGDEIFYIFGDPLKSPANYTHDDKIVSKKMMQYWANFAKTGDPNKSPGGVSRGEWPLFKNDTREHLIIRGDLINRLEKSQAIGAGSRVTQCSFWKEYLPDLVVKTDLLQSFVDGTNSAKNIHSTNLSVFVVIMTFVRLLIG